MMSNADAGSSLLDYASDGAVANVIAWGPASTGIGLPFTFQVDGYYCIWFDISPPLPPVLEVYVAGRRVRRAPIFDNRVLLKFEPDEAHSLFSHVGLFEISFLDVVKNTKQVVASFSVVPPLALTTDWGTQNAVREDLKRLFPTAI